NPRKLVGFHQHTFLNFVPADDRRQHRESDIVAREKAHHRHILDFGRDLRADAETLGQHVETGSDAAFWSRKDDWMSAQAIDETAPLPAQALWRTDETDGLLGQATHDEGRQVVARRYLIDQ